MPRCLRSQLTSEQAWDRLHARAYAMFRALLRNIARRGPASARRTELLQLNQLATYLVTFHFPGREVSALVEGFEGYAALIDLRRVVWSDREESLEFAPTLPVERAIESAREVLWRARSSNPRKLVGDEVAEPTIELIGHPYWAYYYERLSGKLDAKLLDAVTGKLAGPRVKIALLRALASQAGQPAGNAPTGP